MKIAIFRNDLTIVDTNNYNSQELGLARGFSQLGHSVDVFTVADAQQRKVVSVQESPENIRFIYLPYWRIPVLEAPVFKNLGFEFRVGSYDLVQINDEGSIAAYQIAKYCSFHSIPYVIYQGMYRVLSGRSRSVYEKIHNFCFRTKLRKHSKKVLAKTSSAAEFLKLRRFKDVSILPVGVDPTPFVNRRDNDWKHSLGIPPSKRVLLYVGILEYRRQPMFLIDIAEHLKDGNYHLVVVGSGPQLESIKNKVADLGLHNVSLVGNLPQTDLPSLYEQSDCFLLPSTFEIYGMVVLESLYFGLPVVSTATAGPMDIIDTTHLGKIVDVLEVSEWQLAIEEVLNYGKREVLTLYRREQINSRYSWNVLAGQYLDLIET